MFRKLFILLLYYTYAKKENMLKIVVFLEEKIEIVHFWY
jgi:hypothetical protein